MKIEHLRFKNLNSLVGEWQIDFTHTAYDDGIFAIIGATGAGKSTILDAICLALYGSTPRLNKLTKSDNAIMSRQTGECFAEVTFSTNKGRYRSHWSQKRAYKKAHATLQSPQHELSYADTESGKIISNKATKVSKEIEKITGMDFIRFTRTILLAQGSFAVFLQANSDQRAPILEQITGSEIYTDISKAIHQRKKTEDEQLKLLNAEIDGLQLLDEPAIADLNTKCSDLVTKQNQFKSQNNALKQIIETQKTIVKATQSIEDLKLEEEQLKEKKEVFESDLTRLKWADKALNLLPLYTKLESLNDTQNKANARLADIQQNMPHLTQEVNAQKSKKIKSDQDFENKKIHAEKHRLLFKQVATLDTQLNEKYPALVQLKDELAQLKTKIAQNNQDISQQTSALNHQKALQQALKNYLIEHKADEQLIKDLTGISHQFKTYQKQAANLDHLEDKISQQNSQSKALQQTIERNKIITEKAQQQFELAEKIHLEAEQQYQKISKEQPLEQWYESRDQFNQQIHQLEQAYKQSIELNDLNTQINKNKISLQALIENQQINQQQLQEKQQQFIHAEEKQTLLEIQYAQSQQIQSHEEARHILEDGEACPLCGALEHPFVKNTDLPQINETKKALQDIKKTNKALNQAINQLKIEKETLSHQINDLNQQQATSKQAIQDMEMTLKDCCQQFNIPFILDELSNQLQVGLAAIQQKQQVYSEQIEQLKQLKSALKPLENELNKAQLKLTDINRQHAQDQQAQATVNKEIERLSGEKINHEKDQEILYQNILKQIKPYGFIVFDLQNASQIEQQLSEKQTQWQEKSSADQQIKHQIAQQQQTIEQAQTTLETDQQAQQNLQEISQQKKKEYQNIKQQRFDLFEDKQLDHEENKLNQQLKISEQTCIENQQQLNHINNALTHAQSEQQTIEKQINEQQQIIQQTALAFKQQLETAGFKDQIRFKNACLDKVEYEALKQQAEQLKHETSKLKALLTAEKERLKTAETMPSNQQPIVQNEADLKQNESQLEIYQKEIGSIEQQLTTQKEQQALFNQQFEKIKSQKKECARWLNLYALIGSSDGKKYRNFAQGLTFELMVQQANIQLEKMSDRYLLIRNTDKPLELDVIDQYQAGEIRATKNLSGGESFIISLALALGLSQMASQKHRVDSLFLDEGFGTLDEESLEIALNTLSNLQQSGKLIGIISHVSHLKERINTQIVVHKKTGGNSKLSGNGVKKM